MKCIYALILFLLPITLAGRCFLDTGLEEFPNLVFETRNKSILECSVASYKILKST